jgi:dipeptidyl aminopeptidase/acylaminoacyl peptidase
MNDRTIRSIIVFAAFCFLSSVASAQRIDDGKILEREKYQFPAFENVKGPDRSFSKQEYTRAVNDAAFEMERLKYSSDGLAVAAYLYKPRNTNGKKYPLIIYNRGGYIQGNIGYELVPMFRRLALEGFAVIAPLYRASDGAGGKDEVGGDDVNDLMNIAPLARLLDFVDAKNVFLYGESRGGMMSLQAIRSGFPANAAATFGAFTDFEALIAANPNLYQPLIKTIWPDFDVRKEEIAKRRSAIQWADKINTPLLLMHGGADRSVDPMQTINLARELQRLGKAYELVIYNGDNHTLQQNQLGRDAHAVRWFKKHLKP